MKYCQECGTKLKEAHQHPKNYKGKNNEKDNPKKHGFLKAAGILIIIAASLCFIVGIIGILTYTNGTCYDYPSDSGYGMSINYDNCMHMNQYVLTAAVGFFAFAYGLISGILMLVRKLFSLTMIGQVSIIGAAILLVSVEFWFFLLLGIPILVLASISVVFASISRDEFIS